jgi:predicted phage tail protein
MLRAIHLHGALGRDFGRVHELDVGSPAEAIRALCTMLPGFRARVEAGLWQVFRGARRSGNDIAEHELAVGFGDEAAMHLVPRAKGAARRGLGKILLGAALIAVSFLMPAAPLAGTGLLAAQGVSWGTTFAGLGLSLGLSGISMMLAPPMTSSYDDREQPRSKLFGQGGNVSVPGAAVPVIAGRCVTSYTLVASAAVHIEDAESDA